MVTTDFVTRGLPLHGMRILDLTHHIAGPYATKLLADYGADVIKVERPPLGDPTRTWPPFYDGRDGLRHGALFAYLNAGKTSVVLDLKHPAGRDALLRLVAHCDAVVENFMPGVMERLGLSFETLLAVRKDIILTSISNFGRKGRFRNYEAAELNVFAFAGKMAAAGVRPRPPVRLIEGAAEYLAGSTAAGATLIALHGRERDGQGDHLDVSIAHVLLGEPTRGLNLFSYSHTDVERPDAPRPFQVFPAADGFVVINLNRGIDRVAAMIERPELATDPRFASNAARARHHAELEAAIMEWTVPRTKAEIIAVAGRFRVITAQVSTLPEVLHAEHLRERGYFRTVQGPDGSSVTVPGPPFRIHTSPSFGIRPQPSAPQLGAGTVETLEGLPGLGRDQLDELLACGAAQAAPRIEGATP